jgi:hypothetical protein
MLLDALLELLTAWRPAFRRSRTYERVIAVLIGLLCAQGRRTLTQSIRIRGSADRWSADYRGFSRAPWNQHDLFRPALAEASAIHRKLCGDAPLVIHVDDTSTPKGGRSGFVRWMKDPLSPPFHVNLRRGLRFQHFAADLPLHREGFDARAVSVAFDLVPSLKKPGKKATAEEVVDYRKRAKTSTLAHTAVQRLGVLREQLAASGLSNNVLLVGDGSYTNQHLLRNLPAGVHYLGRARKDLALYRPASGPGRRIYGERLPTPQELRQDESIPWKVFQAHFGGKPRDVRVKVIGTVLWRGGARRRELRLLILAPVPYQGPRRVLYRDPAYLLTTDVETQEIDRLVQAYLDRWQIEVVHRECKQTHGLGQAQVWSNQSVQRLYSAHVAMSSLLVLAAYRAFGPARTEHFAPRPPWRSRSPTDRPSYADLVDRLREDYRDRLQLSVVLAAQRLAA